MSNSLELTRTFTSFSGVDIRAVIGGVPIGQLQAISYAVQREKAPIYVMGRVDPLSFSRGKRGIAGTIITLMLDQHILFSDTFSQLKFIADNDEIFPNVGDLNEADYSNAGNFNLNDLDEVSTASFTPSDLSSGFTASSAWYVDQIPPFDVVIIAANEYGQAAQMRIYGIEILNEGSGFSIDDMVIENQMTYVCRTILPWQRMGSWDVGSSGQLTNNFTPHTSAPSTGP
jgi:hypothetical protein